MVFGLCRLARFWALYLEKALWSTGVGLCLAPWPRASRDQYLIDRRADGFTYREIKEAGGYAEAEPILRGRWRTLTKEPEQRLRKPVWKQHDLEMPGVEFLCFFVAWDLSPRQACNACKPAED
ncbi:hypothetical protein LRP88_03372 [Fusarium phalaenopsidis]